MFGAYEPTIWNLQWTSKTKILAVMVSGYHRQVIAGIPPSYPNPELDLRQQRTLQVFLRAGKRANGHSPRNFTPRFQ
jgi:hypothetical protein